MFIRRNNKYGNHKTEIDNITFSSKKEANRYAELKMFQKAGVISHLELQPRFELLESFKDFTGKKHQGIDYVADFSYLDHKFKSYIVEDVKGMRTAVYLLKKKLFLAKYPLLIFREI